jgi:hypothetical protein
MIYKCVHVLNQASCCECIQGTASSGIARFLVPRASSNTSTLDISIFGYINVF